MYVHVPCAAYVHVTQGHAHMHGYMSMRGGTAADPADFADISLALAAPLTFSWCQINLDLARCHIHLGTHLQTRDLRARLQKHGHA